MNFKRSSWKYKKKSKKFNNLMDLKSVITFKMINKKVKWKKGSIINSIIIRPGRVNYKLKSLIF